MVLKGSLLLLWVFFVFLICFGVVVIVVVSCLFSITDLLKAFMKTEQQLNDYSILNVLVYDVLITFKEA